MLRITHLKWLLSLLIPAGAYFAVLIHGVITEGIKAG